MRFFAVLSLLWRRIRKAKLIKKPDKHKICLRNLWPTYVSFNRPLPPSTITNDSMAENAGYRLYTISSPSSTNYATFLYEESDDEYGYAVIEPSDCSGKSNPHNYKQIGGMRRVEACSDLINRTFSYPDKCTKGLRQTGSLADERLFTKFLTPPQFMPICTSTPLFRSCLQFPTASMCKEKPHFYRLQNKQLSVPTIRPPPLPKDDLDDEEFIALNEEEQEFWEIEVARDDENLDNVSQASSESTLLLEAHPSMILDETFIEEVTIYADSEPTFLHDSDKNVTYTIKKAADTLVAEIFMSKSIII